MSTYRSTGFLCQLTDHDAEEISSQDGFLHISQDEGIIGAGRSLEADWKYMRIYNPQRRLRVLVERCRKDSSHKFGGFPKRKHATYTVTPKIESTLNSEFTIGSPGVEIHTLC
ncbi:hypothetical protein TNCV_122521 [Trichonephila clavipes]|nr:hypothetical protein TNCV_122521 [Trichonephila clavipes]